MQQLGEVTEGNLDEAAKRVLSNVALRYERKSKLRTRGVRNRAKLLHYPKSRNDFG